jgi:hypothetical protein
VRIGGWPWGPTRPSEPPGDSRAGRVLSTTVSAAPPRWDYRRPMPLIFHWGGPRHGAVDDVAADRLTSSVLVYDGPHWFGVYQRFEPVQVRDTADGPAEVWVVRE